MLWPRTSEFKQQQQYNTWATFQSRYSFWKTLWLKGPKQFI